MNLGSKNESAASTGAPLVTESTPLVSSSSETNNKPENKWKQFFPWNRGDKSRSSINRSRHDSIIKNGRFAATSNDMPRNQLSKEELQDLVESFADQDRDEDKTWARRLVENVLQNQKWYFPRRDVENAPSLSKAWAFYEHMTLPRYFWKSADHVFRLADPGVTDPTSLYRPATMPEECFVQWGIGVDQYFSSVKLLCFMFLICACINIPNMLYYSSAAYSTGKDHLPWSLRASAICARKVWAVCVDCTADHWNWAEVANTFGTAPDGTVLVQRNDCGGEMMMDGAVDFATFAFVAIFMTALSIYLHVREVRFDEDRLTADDYSVVVLNPPAHAFDPDEWRDFFNQFAHKQVTVVTVALDNAVLLKQLVQRRKHLDRLRKLLPDNVDPEDERKVQETLSKLISERQSANRNALSKMFEQLLRSTGLLIDPETLVEQIRELTGNIEELQKREYNVARVFVSFETEEGQRQALSALSHEPTLSFRPSTKNIPTFRGLTLHVDRAVDPSSVRWLDLGTIEGRTILVMTVNLVITLLVIFVAAYIENFARKSFGPLYAGILVSVFNTTIPLVVEALMGFEQHGTEGSWQISYFAKLTLFRWVNTSIITKVATPLIANLDDAPSDVLPGMRAILLSELLVTPFLRYLDIGGNVQRHIVAPRALTQPEMDLNFLGTPYRLGERFTALTNILFVCCFYSALYPAVFLFGFAILLVQYYTDKYCLVRIWRQSAAIGPRLARICRRYFFNLALVVFIVSSAFSWAQFPYDNVCDKEGSTERVLRKTYDNVRLLDGSIINVTVHGESPVYYCSQDIQDFDTTLPFPPTPGIQPDGYKWMTVDQEKLSAAFGWTSVAVVVGFIVYFLQEIVALVSSLIRPTYKPCTTKSQRIDFSCVNGIDAYFPQIKLDTHPYPLLACDVDGVDKDLIGWSDPKHSYDRHNLVFDVPCHGLRKRRTITHLVNEKDSSDKRNDDEKSKDNHEMPPIFSVVKHYPPEWQRRLRVEREMIGTSLSDDFDNSQSWLPLC